MAYFGACTGAGVASGTTGNNDASFLFWRAYTCPDTGTQHLSMLESMVNSNGATDVDIRLGIYNSAGTALLAQTGVIRLATSSTDTWQGEAVSVDLVGGTDYILAWTVKAGTGAYTTHADETRSDGSIKDTDYTAGLPTPLPAPIGTYVMYPIRAYVEAEGGAVDSNFIFSRW